MTHDAFPSPGSTPIALSSRTHERDGERRTDEAWLDRAWADPRTRVVVLAGTSIPVTEDGDAVRWTAAAGLSEGERIFLGTRDGVAHFALLLEDPIDDLPWSSLRGVLATMAEADAGLLVHAVSLAEWRASHRFCPRCGGRLLSRQAGHVLDCDTCGRHQFPRSDPAVIMMVTAGDEALLGRQLSWPEGRYSTLAGFVEPGESLEDAVVREVAEETAVRVTDVVYFGNQPWPFPASLMLGFFARATTVDITVDGEEISDARWFTREQMRAEAEAGTLALPGGISISRSLIEAWYGGPLPGSW